nr:6-hydroxymethylpterin diphosphokinase MptE-like protein [Fredinandcohnia onubensis]
MDKKKILIKSYNKLVNTRENIRYHLNKNNMKFYTKKNLELKNKHKGERCFILGNGPSLKGMDLTKIQNEKIFAVNFFAKSYLFPQIQPTYYCMLDGAFGQAKHIDDAIHILNAVNANFLLGEWAIKAFEHFDTSQKKIYYSFSSLIQYGDSTCYDFAKITTGSPNVINHCIKWALFMGFDEIYLLGCDFNQFARPKQGHFYGSKPAHESNSYRRGMDLMYSSQALFDHYALEKESRKINSKIFNATPNSLIDAYETVDYNSIFEHHGVNGKILGEV